MREGGTQGEILPECAGIGILDIDAIYLRADNGSKCGNRFSFAIDVQGGKMLIQLKTLSYKAALLSMVLGLLGFSIALAASGDLDTTFSGDGLLTTNFGPSNPGRQDYIEALAIQSN